MEEIAAVYARSLFEVASDQGEIDTIHDQLGEFVGAIDQEHQFQVFFFSPYFSSEEKKNGLKASVVDASPILMNFLELLVEKHRMPAIFWIKRNYEALWEEHHRRLSVRVTSAVELDDETIKHIGDQISAQTGRNVQLSKTVDPDILGGLVIRVGNVILDASIEHRLQQLRKQVAKAA